jgi:hypothetical protein
MAIVTITIRDKFHDGEIELDAVSSPRPKDGEGLTVAQLIGNTVAGMIRDGSIAKHIENLEKSEEKPKEKARIIKPH